VSSGKYKVGPRRKILYVRGRNRGQAVQGKNRYYTPKPPRGAPGSDEAVLYSGNILYDPGFELFVQNAAPTFLKPGWSDWTGSNCYLLPRFDINAERGQVWPNGDEVSYYDIAQWAQLSEPYVIADDVREASAWFVVRREAFDLDFSTIRGPKLGKFMARWYNWNSSALYPGGNSIPGGLVIQGPGMPPGYSGRTEVGAFITWAVHCWVTFVTADPTMDLVITFYKQDGSPIHTVNSSHTLTNTKDEYVLQSWTPGGSYFMRTSVTFRGSNSSSSMVQVDTARLGVE
jgi:hypothetical protein